MKLPLLPAPRSVAQRPGRFALQGVDESRLPTEQCVDPSIAGPEAYRLTISEDGVLLRGGGEPGLFYGRQTLRQLRAVCRDSLPCCEIEDAPAFAHRGFMLDCVRHFFPVEDLKKLIEAAALFKLNIFHWHLVDDQGWRLPVDRYPRLVTIGSRRPFSNFGRAMEPEPYGGSYTKEEIREIVRFCAARHIDVIPEIEMPGHASALLAAYPQFSCTGEPVQVKTRGGVHTDVLCAGKDAVYEAMEQILDEVIELFPYHKIHLGGDEAPKEHWAKCPDCQKRMQQQGLRTEEELQGYFTNRMAGYLKDKGRTAVVWNDALKGGNLSPGVEVQYWIGGMEPTLAHVNAGGTMIMSDFFHYYLDYSYGQTRLGKVLGFDPVPEGLSKDARARMDGVEGPIWTEYMPDLKQVGYMAFPRLAAVAQAGWTGGGTPQDGSFEDSFRRILPLLLACGITPAPPNRWNMKKPLRIWDALKFWHHAMTREDMKAFLRQMKREREEKKKQQAVEGEGEVYL